MICSMPHVPVMKFYLTVHLTITLYWPVSTINFDQVRNETLYILVEPGLTCNHMYSNLMLTCTCNLFSQRMQSNFGKREINTRQQITLKSMFF